MIILCPKIFSFCERGGKARALRHAEGAKGRETSAAAEGGDRRHAPVRGSGAEKVFPSDTEKRGKTGEQKGFFPFQ